MNPIVFPIVNRSDRTSIVRWYVLPLRHNRMNLFVWTHASPPSLEPAICLLYTMMLRKACVVVGRVDAYALRETG